MQSLTPNINIFACENFGEIRIRNGSKYQCINYNNNSEKLQKIMLKNLNIKSKKINYDNILPPRQAQENCWFNVYFMCFFISDKGRKFFRYLRTIMIKGKLSNGKMIESGIREPFQLLNVFIEASFIGKKDPKRFASVMNTNLLIHSIGEELRNYGFNVPRVNEPGNPITLYQKIINYLGSDDMSMVLKYATRYDIYNNDVSSFMRPSDKIPDIIYISQTDKEEDPEDLNIEITLTLKQKNIKYRLDSAILRSQDKKHFTAYITGNKKQYAFDGESFSTLIPFSWKSKINSNVTWKFQDLF